MSRLIKDIKDNSSGNLIYPRSHVKAITYNETTNLLDYLTYNVTTEISNAIAKVNNMESTINKQLESITYNSVSNIPTTNRLVFITISSSGSFTLDGHNQPEVHIIIKNSGSSDITISLPTSGNYIVVDEKTSVTISANKYAEINAVSDGTSYYLRSC